MHLETVLTQMKSMRLTTMANSLESRLGAQDHQDLSHEESVSLLINDEHEARQSRKLDSVWRDITNLLHDSVI